MSREIILKKLEEIIEKDKEWDMSRYRDMWRAIYEDNIKSKYFVGCPSHFTNNEDDCLCNFEHEPTCTMFGK